MNAAEAWDELTRYRDKMGVRHGQMQCFPRSEGLIECYVSDDSDEYTLMDRDEFMAEHRYKVFRKIKVENL